MQLIVILHIGINQKRTRTINQIDSQGMKREYKNGNSCALFNIISEMSFVKMNYRLHTIQI